MDSSSREHQFLERLDRHKGILYKVANVYCGDREDRADLIQEIIIQLWRSFDWFDGRAQFSTWMHRIALNVAISFHRGTTRNRRETLPIEDFELDLGAADRQLESEGDDIRRLYQLIGQLDDINKAIILLYLDGHGHDDIAEAIGITTTNVATRVNRIKQKLQREFDAGART